MKDKINKIMNEIIIPNMMKFVNIKPIVALKDGILFTLPLLMIGSIFLLIANFPYAPFTEFLSDKGLTGPLAQVNGATFSIIALVAVIGVTYCYVKNEGYEPMSAGFIAFAVFLITTNSYATNADGAIVENVISKEWTSGQGMITAIIIGLVVGSIYSWFMKKEITIKMPEGVPSSVANSFASLIPGAFLITGALIIYIFFKNVMDTTMVEFIYKIIQTPLQGMTDSIYGVIAYCLIATILWWFGVHGGTIVTGIMLPILLSNISTNQAIVDSGNALTIQNGAHIVTDQFTSAYINLTGTGITLGLVIYMVFFAKCQQFKQMGKLALIPGIFNINEPVIFGTPIVMNPFLLAPFVLTPTVVGVLMYLVVGSGLVPPFSGVVVPWTCPAIISGFLLGGWKMALSQAVILVISLCIYFPFIRKVDLINLEKEKENANALQ